MRRIWGITGMVICLVTLCAVWGLTTAEGDGAKAEIKEEKKAALEVKSSVKEAAKEAAAARKEKAKKKDIVSETVESKQVSGDVVSLFPKKDAKFIGIEMKGMDTEYHFVIAEDVTVVNKESLAEIVLGDTVTIVYEETKTKKKDGKEKAKRVATTITFKAAASDGILKIEK